MADINALTGQMPGQSITAGTVAGVSGELGPSQRPRDLLQAAQQFESLLIAELLRAAHSEEGGWLGAGEDSTASPAIGLAEESMAQSIASHGGLGLSKFVTQRMSR